MGIDLGAALALKEIFEITRVITSSHLDSIKQ